MQPITLTSDDGKSVTVNCSPNTSRRIELNEEFREQVFKDKLRVDEETDFEPITEIGEENSPQPPTCEEYQGDRSKAVWLETDCLRGEILAQLELGEDSRPPATADADELPLEDSLLLEAPQPKKKKRASTIAGELCKWREQFAEENKYKREYRKDKLEAYKERTEELRKSRDQRQQILDLYARSLSN